MKRLPLLAVLAVAGLTGCVVAPVGPGYYHRQRPVVVAPPPPPPVVIVRPGYDDRRWDRGYRYDRQDRDGRRWRGDRDD